MIFQSTPNECSDSSFAPQKTVTVAQSCNQKLIAQKWARTHIGGRAQEWRDAEM
jgi:hypothetical protein